MDGIIERVRKHQRELPKIADWTAIPHKPTMLYIGCIDARLDPVYDIGIQQGEALIHRKIGALVAGLDKEGKALDLSEAASIEFALNVVNDGKGVEHIVVAAHTKCGGLGACLHPLKTHTDYLSPYLQPIMSWWKGETHHEDHAKNEHEMEQGSVRKSIDKLRLYPCVQEAEKRGVKLHGWVIDTDTKEISEMDPETKVFSPMAKHAMDRNAGVGMTR